MRRLTAEERAFLYDECTGPCELDPGEKGTPRTQDEIALEKRLKARGLVALEHCACGNLHTSLTALGREALLVAEAVEAIEGRTAA